MGFELITRILDTLKKKKFLLIKKASSGTQSLIASRLFKKGVPVVAIFPDNSSLEEFEHLLKVFYPEKDLTWDRDWVFFKTFDIEDESGWAYKWLNLFVLNEKKSVGVALTVDNLLPYFLPRQVINDEYLYLTTGSEISLDHIIGECIDWGYERVEVVSEIGEIALRGGILDVFSACYDFPIRIEFFGDTIESIRLFDPVTQRSKKVMEDVLILPITPCICKKKYVEEAVKKWEYLWKVGYISKKIKIELEEKARRQKSLFLLPSMFYHGCLPLKDMLPRECVFLLVGGEKLRDKLEESLCYFKNKLENLFPDLPCDICFQLVNQARDCWINRPQMVFDDLFGGREEDFVELFEKKLFSYQDLLWNGNYAQRPYSSLVASLKEWRNTYFQTILTFGSSKRRDRFLKFLEGSSLEIKTDYRELERGIFALVSDFAKGSELKWADILIISERILQLPSWKEEKRPEGFKGLKKIDEIKPGDFVVHRDYGIGKFMGLTHLSINNLKNDFLEILYANNDKLFLPVDRLNLIQKFKAPDHIVPVLDKLGSNKWSLTKEKVRRALQKVAFDLVRMYAYRKVGKGFAFPPADDLYKEFEATFGFEETPDQEKVIQEVIKDMESSKPMDRLVCGDAGFGKTEVAMRAAFKAVCGGKQVLLLCPTTVLAEQHYITFKERMKEFPVTVAMLSRFVPKVDQKKIIKDVSEGKIDILIGTHRVLSDDVKLPRLGLFIIDEEQRFGVSQKEKIKKLRKDIDVLTLTATPIPRTLQLSLSGIRDLSVIETPPPDRKAVKSYFMVRDPERLKEALVKELNRGGQVFWVYNKINGLKEVKQFVQSLVPEARVAMAHGRMAEKTLEETMHRFWKGEIDILVCTSIIESGLDFPNANTIIIDNAHMFGLGQLYQLRGRVGRSERQGYAYFVVPTKKGLSSLAEKRLQTIMNLDFLGAGFHIAMEDLRIRGAGNILGEAQTGYINKVGLDMFLEILEKEIKKAKGEQVKEEVNTELNIYIPAHIPENYISSHQERLLYYKLMASCENSDELDRVVFEIKDRFGTIPEALLNLKAVFELKLVFARLQVKRADLYPNRIIFYWDENSFPFEIHKVLKWIEKNKNCLKLFPDSRVEFCYNEIDEIKPLNILVELKKVLEDLIKLGSNDREVTTC